MWYDDSMMVTIAANETQNKIMGRLCHATNSSCRATSLRAGRAPGQRAHHPAEVDQEGQRPPPNQRRAASDTRLVSQSVITMPVMVITAVPTTLRPTPLAPPWAV